MCPDRDRGSILFVFRSRNRFRHGDVYARGIGHRSYSDGTKTKITVWVGAEYRTLYAEGPIVSEYGTRAMDPSEHCGALVEGRERSSSNFCFHMIRPF